jgi:hypothetical protein
MAMGLAAGLARGSRRRAGLGAVGGLIGGIVGGAAYYPAYAALLDVLPFDNAISWTSLMQNIFLGASIGMALALVEVSARHVKAAASQALVALNPVPSAIADHGCDAQSSTDAEPLYQRQQEPSVLNARVQVADEAPRVVALHLVSAPVESGKDVSSDVHVSARVLPPQVE